MKFKSVITLAMFVFSSITSQAQASSAFSYKTCEGIVDATSESRHELSVLSRRSDAEQLRYSLHNQIRKTLAATLEYSPRSKSDAATALKNMFVEAASVANNPRSSLKELEAHHSLLKGVQLRLGLRYVTTSEEALRETLVQDFRMSASEADMRIVAGAREGLPLVTGLPQPMLINGWKWILWTFPLWHLIPTEVPESVLKRVARLSNYGNRASLDEMIVREFIKQTHLEVRTSQYVEPGEIYTAVENTRAKFYRGFNGKMYAQFWLENRKTSSYLNVRLLLDLEVDEETGNYSNPRLMDYREN